MTMQPVGKCRVCHSKDLIFLFSLGEQFASDFVDLDKVHSGIKCPIELEICQLCFLVQQRYTAPQELLYLRHYWFRSGSSATNREALTDVARAAERLADLKPGDVVLDLGSNTGELLRSYAVPGLVKVGVEPATNLAEGGAKGLDVFINDFFSADAYFARMIDWRRTVSDRTGHEPGIGWRYYHCVAKVITACGMIYDLPDPNLFIADVAKALAPDGVFIAQLMCLKQTIEMSDVGNYCHEHLLFFSLRSLNHLFSAHGLQIFDVEENNVNGGSYRLYVGHAGAREVSSRVAHALVVEESMGLVSKTRYKWHRIKMESSRAKCVNFIKREVSAGKRVHVRGASTKGNVILQYYGLDNSLIEAASDRSPEKHGKYTIGTGIPIKSPEESRRMKPDLYLVLPYAFVDEILHEERDWLMTGGRFLIPLPAPYVVAADPKDLPRRDEWEPRDRMPLLEVTAL